MSSSRGNSARSRPQKYQNKSAFKNDLHDKSKRTKTINLLEVTGVCERCKHIIQWKIKYKKYKPLTAPTKCVGCEQKTVKHAYHLMCGNCAKQKNVCAKCAKPFEVNGDVLNEVQSNESNTDLQSVLRSLSERKRRSLLRYLDKSDDKKVNDLLTSIKDIDIGEDDSDLDFQSDDDD